MRKPTQKQRVINEFKKYGVVTNFWAMSNYILRLASIISTMRQGGWDIKTVYKGKVGEKNCHYYLNTVPTKTILEPQRMDDRTVRMIKKQVPMF